MIKMCVRLYTVEILNLNHSISLFPWLSPFGSFESKVLTPYECIEFFSIKIGIFRSPLEMVTGLQGVAGLLRRLATTRTFSLWILLTASNSRNSLVENFATYLWIPKLPVRPAFNWTATSRSPVSTLTKSIWCSSNDSLMALAVSQFGAALPLTRRLSLRVSPCTNVYKQRCLAPTALIAIWLVSGVKLNKIMHFYNFILCPTIKWTGWFRLNL